MRLFLILYLLVFGVRFSAASEGKMPRRVSVLVEYYELGHAALRPMLREYQSHDNASALLKKVALLAKEGNARMVESAYLVSHSGRRATIRSCRELIYPTQYDPGIESKVPSNPESFEPRALGLSLEFDALLYPDGKSMRLEIAPELVEFHGYNDWGQEASFARMPRFYARTLDTAVTLTSGETELLGVHVPWSAREKEGEGNRVLCFVTAMSFEPGSDKDDHLDELNRLPPLPRQKVSVLTEYVDVDACLASRLAREVSGDSDASAIRRHLDKAIEDGSAVILETNLLSSDHGERAKNESNQELIYPTEFDPAKAVEGSRYLIPAGPSAFEMRPAGCSVEFEPVISPDGGFVEIHIHPEIVRHVRHLSYGSGAGEAQQPLFETLDISTALRVESGKTALIGIHSLETARAGAAATPEERAVIRDRRVMVFITPQVVEE